MDSFPTIKSEIIKCGQRLSRTTINEEMKPVRTAEVNMANVPNVKSNVEEEQKLIPSNKISWESVVYRDKHSPPMTVANTVRNNRVRVFMTEKEVF